MPKTVHLTRCASLMLLASVSSDSRLQFGVGGHKSCLGACRQSDVQPPWCSLSGEPGVSRSPGHPGMHVRRQTIQEAIREGPGSAAQLPGSVQRGWPKAGEAEYEGVSINSLATAIIAEALGFRQGAGPRRRWGSEHNGGGGTPPAESRRGVNSGGLWLPGNHGFHSPLRQSPAPATPPVPS